MMKEKFNRGNACKSNGFSYLGNTRQSAKLQYSYNAGYETYGIYLAPATLARDEKHPHINVCPFSQICASHCLNNAGRNKVAKLALANNNGRTKIDNARINRTHLFYDNRELFMKILISELKSARERAKRNNKGFAVRLNCTSDLSPELFTLNGKNILELFPDVQFYDYTKVPAHLGLMFKYPNYDLTYSYDGSPFSEKIAKQFLANGGKVAVVFDINDKDGKQTLPETFWGYEVKDANGYDMRFLDEPKTIMGLHYHRVSDDYVRGKYEPRETSFVIRSI